VLSSSLWEYRHWEKGTRFYAATLQQDLFGEWQVQRQWGAKGRRGKRVVTDYAPTYEDALALLDATAKRRRQRGYIASDEEIEAV
jgi:predicted DNA-binding WGR domain protein